MNFQELFTIKYLIIYIWMQSFAGRLDVLIIPEISQFPRWSLLIRGQHLFPYDSWMVVAQVQFCQVSRVGAQSWCQVAATFSCDQTAWQSGVGEISRVIFKSTKHHDNTWDWTDLSVSSWQWGLPRPLHSCCTPASVRLLLLRSSSLRWDGWVLRTADRYWQHLSESWHPQSLEKQKH